MKLKVFGIRTLVILIALTLAVPMAVVPEASFAASTKATYSVKFKNIDSNTVIKKGKKLKVKYQVTKGKKVKKVKVGFKSSNKKIATISKKGVIKAKKNGKVKITVYLKKKKKIKKTVTIKVGKPVTSIKITGQVYMRPGHKSDLDVTVSPKSATNKKVTWKSSDKTIATVSKNGNITAKKDGKVTITAKAKDGSGKHRSVTVYIHEFRKNETKWIAHRGLHVTAKENTEEAFVLAGKAGFWGCESDIRETKHDAERQVLPEEAAGPEDPVDPDDPADPTDPDGKAEVQDGSEIDQAALDDLRDAIDKLPPADNDDLDDTDYLLKVLERRDDIEYAQELYDGLSDEQKQALIEVEDDKDNDVELLDILFDAKYALDDYDSFDLAISHDTTFSRVFGVDEAVGSVTADEIRSDSRLSGVCFLRDYLEVCKAYGMVPVIEIKGDDMSPGAQIKTIKLVMEIIGSLDKDDVRFIGFYSGVLTELRACCNEIYGIEPYISYLIKDTDIDTKVKRAHTKGFSGINIKKTDLTEDVMKKASEYGLIVGTWTYEDELYDDEELYMHLVSGKFDIESVTTDGKLFK